MSDGKAETLCGKIWMWDESKQKIQYEATENRLHGGVWVVGFSRSLALLSFDPSRLGCALSQTNDGKKI